MKNFANLSLNKKCKNTQIEIFEIVDCAKICNVQIVQLEYFPTPAELQGAELARGPVYSVINTAVDGSLVRQPSE